MKEIHLEDDPDYSCRLYYAGEYDDCLEREYSSQCLQLLNCTPPWITEDEHLWCSDHLNMSLATAEQVRFLLGKYF